MPAGCRSTALPFFVGASRTSRWYDGTDKRSKFTTRDGRPESESAATTATATANQRRPAFPTRSVGTQKTRKGVPYKGKGARLEGESATTKADQTGMRRGILR